MDKGKGQQIRKQVREQFRLGRAKLFRVETETQVRSEIATDRQLLLKHFKQQEALKQLQLTEALFRLLLNYSILASYRGVVEGYEAFRLGLKLGRDGARYHVITHLQKHPTAKNHELIRYLDRKNGRLEKLRTSKNDPLWARLPDSLEQKLAALRIPMQPGEFWEEALKACPNEVMQYLGRVRRMARDPRNNNVLSHWPRIVLEHRKRRKAGN